MRIKVERKSITDIPCDLLVVNLFEDAEIPSGSCAAVNKVLDGLIVKLMKEGEISGKSERVTLIHTHDKIPAKRVVVVGLGKTKKFDMNAIRTAASAAIQVAKKVKAAKVCSIVHGAGTGKFNIIDAARATVEGTLIGSYEYEGIGREKDEPVFKVKEFIIVERDKIKMIDIRQGATYGEIFGRAAVRAKDLVNAPSNVVTPNYLANYARDNARKVGVKCDVFDITEIKKMGLEALWNVARGSEEREKLIVMRWNGGKRGDKEVIGLIGKGVTFDSGGISLKGSKNLWEMKTDMAGGAAVIEIMIAAARLKVKRNIVAVVPATENMPDGASLKPGDVIGSLSGKTIEIISTDAEGRLILADAVTYAKKLGATKLIDVATLTGGCTVALGDAASGLMGNDQKFVDEVVAASQKSGEKVWQLPLFEEYGEYLKSDVAYIQSCTETGMASPIIGGIFIEKFVEDTPWVHIDIAGTAFLRKKRTYLPRGATGVPVRTVLEYLSGV
ncbi:MAG: leucyl aminopeptidase [Candidatus Margulisbacteria bacterium]|nr:leucyl aminopeptidase [Candidatus Margulisiibacteriota bacterium]